MSTHSFGWNMELPFLFSNRFLFSFCFCDDFQMNTITKRNQNLSPTDASPPPPQRPRCASLFAAPALRARRSAMRTYAGPNSRHSTFAFGPPTAAPPTRLCLTSAMPPHIRRTSRPAPPRPHTRLQALSPAPCSNAAASPSWAELLRTAH